MMKESTKQLVDYLGNLSELGFTGTITVRLSQGGVQNVSVSQEMQPRELPYDLSRRLTERMVTK